MKVVERYQTLESGCCYCEQVDRPGPLATWSTVHLSAFDWWGCVSTGCFDLGGVSPLVALTSEGVSPLVALTSEGVWFHWLL